MATRTLADMIASVARSTGGAVPLGEIHQAIYNANLQIHSRYPWPWLRTDVLITLNAPYTTGTVSLTNGSTAVTGSGTTWDTAWIYKTLRVSNVDYPIASINSATSLTLVQAPVLSAAVTGSAYSIIQDTYALPADYVMGSDVCLQNQTLYYEVKKIPDVQLFQQSVWTRLISSSYVSNYCDYGFDDTNKVYKIKVNPPPAGTIPLKFVYLRKPPDLSQMSATSILPEVFVEILERTAEARVKRERKLGGWQEAEAAANQMLFALKRQIQTQGVVNRPEDHGFNQYDASWRDGIFSAVRGGI